MMRGPSRSETRGHAIAGVRATHAHLLVPVLPKMLLLLTKTSTRKRRFRELRQVSGYVVNC